MDKQEKFENFIDELRKYGCDASIAAFMLPKENTEGQAELFVWFPDDSKDTVAEISSKLVNIFSEALATIQKEDEDSLEIVRNAMASAILPYINGLSEKELAALALQRL